MKKKNIRPLRLSWGFLLVEALFGAVLYSALSSGWLVRVLEVLL